MKNITIKLLVLFLFLNTGLVSFVVASEIDNASNKNVDHSTHFKHSPQHHSQSSIDCIAHCLFNLDLNSYSQDNFSGEDSVYTKIFFRYQKLSSLEELIQTQNKDPPNLHRDIKFYAFSDLTGIVSIIQ